MAVMLFSTEIQTSKRNCNKIPLPQRYDHKFSVQSSNWAGLQKTSANLLQGPEPLCSIWDSQPYKFGTLQTT